MSVISHERLLNDVKGDVMASGVIKSLLSTAMVLLTPAIAFAHTGVGNTNGLIHGFGHPISGIDHVLAMVMVGVFASQLGGRALWLVPTTFVAIMGVAGALGIAGIAVPFVEIGIALSVVILGAIVALDLKAAIAAAMGLVGLFAVFHGYAHGAEIPESAGGVAYAAGFMIGTALLHLTGIGAGFLMGGAGDHHGRLVVRFAGGLAAVAGVVLLIGVL
jgi:urease accessory protein